MRRIHGPERTDHPDCRERKANRPSRRRAAGALALIMVLSATLHAYWASGGMWLLPAIMNSPSGTLPPDVISGPIVVILWIFSAGMLGVAFMALGRAYRVESRSLQRLCVAGLLGFSLVTAAGALFNLLGPQRLGRLVIGPLFLLAGGLAVYLALPQRPGTRTPAHGKADEGNAPIPPARGLRRIALCIVVFLLAVPALFYFVYLPWNLRWGATDEEVNRVMAGDEFCETADFSPTRAITIEASPEKVWPWIVQIGYMRAGFYSYDSLDNAGIPSAERIIPEFQGVKIGDRIPLDRAGEVIVRTLEPDRVFVMAAESGCLTWAWELRETGPQQTRVITRVRARLGDTQMKFVWNAFEFFMMRRCLLGIKRRAESPGHP
ncbi:MAG: DUF3995 domain-containing protein [Planctomycetes bacterium]|nr:DUF3995 domain-containing protein [Planctomycetota bacterium]